MRLSGMRLFLAIAVLCLASGAADGSETARGKSLWGRIASPVAGLFRRGRNAVIRASNVIVWRGRSSTKEVGHQMEITDDAAPMEGYNEVVREGLAGEEGGEEKEVMDMEVETDVKPEIGSLSKMGDSVDDAVDPVETEGSDPKESVAAGETGETGEMGQTASFTQTEGSDLKEVEVAGETASSTEPQGSHEEEIEEDETRTSTETEGSHQEEIAEEMTAFAALSQPEEVEISGTSGEVAETSEVLGEAQEHVPGKAEVFLPDVAEEGALESEVKEATAEVAADGANEKFVEQKADPTVSEL